MCFFVYVYSDFYHFTKKEISVFVYMYLYYIIATVYLYRRRLCASYVESLDLDSLSVRYEKITVA